MRTAALIASLVLLPEWAAAQDAVTSVSSRRGGDDTVVSLDFAGGPLTAYVESIHKAVESLYADDRKTNIILPDLASSVMVPKLALHETSIESALSLVSEIIDDDFDVSTKTLSRGRGKPVYVVRVIERRKRSEPAKAPMIQAEVISLAAIVDPMPGDPKEGISVPATVVLSAIQTAIETGAGEVGRPVIRYHEDSRLLFVSGSLPSLSMVNRITDTLSRDVRERRMAAQNAARANAGRAGGR